MCFTCRGRFSASAAPGTLRTLNARHPERRRIGPILVDCRNGLATRLTIHVELGQRHDAPGRLAGTADAPAPTDGVPILILDDDARFCAASRALASLPFVPFSVRGGANALQFLARTARFEDASRPAFGSSALAETSGQADSRN